jgi:hypothetical protein
MRAIHSQNNGESFLKRIFNSRQRLIYDFALVFYSAWDKNSIAILGELFELFLMIMEDILLNKSWVLILWGYFAVMLNFFNLSQNLNNFWVKFTIKIFNFLLWNFNLQFYCFAIKIFDLPPNRKWLIHHKFLFRLRKFSKISDCNSNRRVPHRHAKSTFTVNMTFTIFNSAILSAWHCILCELKT